MRNRVALTSPWIPPEWIAAHGLRPQWLRLGAGMGQASLNANRGVCPYAGALVEACATGIDAAAVIVTTVCDQMRYAAAIAERRGKTHVFLLNVPSTWKTEAARKVYRDELKRLGKFLVRLGGAPPTDAELASVMRRFESQRADALAGQTSLSARAFADELARARGDLRERIVGAQHIRGRVNLDTADDGVRPLHAASCNPVSSDEQVPLAILGGPLLENDLAILDLVEHYGGRIVLNATEAGQRTLPGAFDRKRLDSCPFEVLIDAYFSIPDAFRRPNDAMYGWLEEEVKVRGVRGILFRRYLWCDLWHAELHRLRQRSRVPVLDIDASHDEESVLSRSVNRIEAFLEMLR